MNKTKAIHLPGLNGIRAIAALLVVVSHTSMQLHFLGLEKGGGIDMAGHGVTMFFVLSGYLITYLLLKEKEQFSSVALRKFYMRRILRIWPLYYLALLISLFIMWGTNNPVSTSGLFFYVFLMANIPFVFGGAIPSVTHLWSVGVEEQFYLFWPWLFKIKKHLPKLMMGIIAGYLILRFALRYFENGNWYTFVGATRFHCMAIGGLGAYALFHQRLPKWCYSRWLQWSCWAIVAVSIYRPFHIASIIDTEIYALIFLVLILNVSTNPRTVFTLEQPLLRWLGKISYGIYVYHMFALSIAFWLIAQLALSPMIKQVMAFTLVVSITCLMAYLSYRFFEKPFLKKKHLFSMVASSPTANKQQR